MNNKNFYITSPIYYVNDVPHIGHAYTSIACDVLARFKKLDGYNVRFLTGTDEHGQKVEKSALAREKTPQEFCDEISAKFREMADFLDISYDDFIRTTEKRHKDVVQIFWKKLSENGWIYKDIYEGWYAVRDEAFYNEDELVNGKAPTGADVSWHKEESYFFRLSEFGKILEELIESRTLHIEPESRKNEVLSFIKSGLKDLSISRTSFKWGIPVPGDEAHIIYVWLDALVNYISALNYPNGENYQKFWDEIRPAPGKVHIVGKDILRFHTVYWPAFLLASKVKRDSKTKTHLDFKTDLPDLIFAHGWWTNEGQKISKSLGNVIDPYKEINWLESCGVSKETAVDYFRYFLMREVPFGNDGDYSRENFVNRINSELANKIGNLAKRSLDMINKNCDGKIPENKFDSNQNKLNIWHSYRSHMAGMSFSPSSAINEIIEFTASANQYFDKSEPWNLKKQNKIEEMNTVLYNTAEMVRKIAILLLPFIPNSAAKILNLLLIDEGKRNFAYLEESLKPNHKIAAESKIIFPKLEIKSDTEHSLTLSRIKYSSPSPHPMDPADKSKGFFKNEINYENGKSKS